MIDHDHDAPPRRTWHRTSNGTWTSEPWTKEDYVKYMVRFQYRPGNADFKPRPKSAKGTKAPTSNLDKLSPSERLTLLNKLLELGAHE